MQPIKTTAEIKKFGYEVGDGYTAVVKPRWETERTRSDLSAFYPSPKGGRSAD